MRLLFIGNRASALREIEQLPWLEVAFIFAVRGSPLHSAPVPASARLTVFAADGKSAVVDGIGKLDFDILLSNGCPFILPVSRLRRGQQIFLNLHPSLLPRGRGRHPVNEALLRGWAVTGATLHHMDDEPDKGRIVHQERIDISDDLDLGLLYRMSFDLEARVGRAGLLKLADASFEYAGEAQTGEASYYSRRPEDQVVDLAAMADTEILRRVRAFGIRSQGLTAMTDAGRIRIFEAARISNPALLQQHSNCRPGMVLLRFEDRLLVRSRDGIIKITSYQMEP